MLEDEIGRRHPHRQQIFQSGDLTPIIFLTLCTKDRQDILANEQAHEALLYAWQRADAFSVGRYVILPDHIHLFCSPRLMDGRPLANWVHYWKGLFSREFWSTGGGKVWQTGFWDTQLRKSDSYSAKWDYVRENPVRHGWVSRAEAWPFQGELHIFDWHDR